MTNYGDAFNDMPEEYRGWRFGVENKHMERYAVGRQAPPIDADIPEADKAIRDGKPRWIHHDQLGWQHVVILENQRHQKPIPLLLYREATDRASSIGENRWMLVNVNVEILPYGETPPAAKPEKPKKTVADARLQIMTQGVLGLLEYVEHCKDEKWIGPAEYSDIRRQCKNMLRKIDYQHPGE